MRLSDMVGISFKEINLIQDLRFNFELALLISFTNIRLNIDGNSP